MPEPVNNDSVPRAFYDMRISQYEEELNEYRDFFNLLVQLLDKHGINARNFHNEI